MRVSDANSYSWRTAPIEIDCDAELAEFIMDMIKEKVMEAAADKDYKKVVDLSKSIVLLSNALTDYREEMKKKAEDEEANAVKTEAEVEAEEDDD